MENMKHQIVNRAIVKPFKFGDAKGKRPFIAKY